MMAETEDRGRSARSRACAGACLAGVAVFVAVAVEPVANAQSQAVYSTLHMALSSSTSGRPTCRWSAIEASGAARRASDSAWGARRALADR